MSTISETSLDHGEAPKAPSWALGAVLIGTAGVAITAGWVVFLFFVVPALMK